MLKKCYYYAQKVPLLCSKFFPRITHFLPPFWKLEYKWVPASQSPHVATSVTCGEVWGSRLSRIFLHRKSGIPISRLYLIPMYLFIYLFIYLFSIFWHISLNFSYYYAGVMLDAHASLLCSKLCRHNVDNPTFIPLPIQKLSLIYIKNKAITRSSPWPHQFM